MFWVEAADNTYLWEKAMDRVGVENLGAMLYDQKAEAGQEVLTPNQSVAYMLDWIDLEEVGPVVYESGTRTLLIIDLLCLLIATEPQAFQLGCFADDQ